MKKSHLIQALWLVGGILLIFVGILALCFFSDLSNIAYSLGAAILFYGLFNVVIFSSDKANRHQKRWILTDGLFTLLVSIILLCNLWITPAAVPVVVAMWIMSASVTRVFVALDLKAAGLKNWFWLIGASLLGIIISFMSLLSGITSFLPGGLITGILLILQGAIAILMWACATGFELKKD